MKATVTFDSKEEMQRALKADDLCSFIWDFQQYLRREERYGDPPDDITAIRAEWFNHLEEHNINLDELWS